ncbi:MAG: helix-turn-helix transcriptional regulator [Candidatus Margulisbacteria bacterium]|jgi:transcriptional regulator with XRE-family HTH domain|nr:helix-turn-helix transcriptional regulator [Candidatus Margulisiibacteriota bacterium]
MPEIDQLKIHIAGRLKELRLSAGLSIQALAEQIGMAFQNYFYLEKGTKSCPKLETLCKIAGFYGVPLDYFFQDYKVPERNFAPLKGRLAARRMLAEFQKLTPAQQALHLHILKAFNQQK